MKTVKDRLCLFCKHFNLDMGEVGYSDWTPPTDARISCYKDHWGPLTQDHGSPSLRKVVVYGRNCSDFELAEDEDSAVETEQQ